MSNPNTTEENMQGIANVRNLHPVERQKEATMPQQTPAQEVVSSLSKLMKMDNRCRCGVRHKNSVARHQLLSASKNYAISLKMKYGTIKIRPGREQIVYEPKKRTVTNMFYADRIVIASFVVYYFYPTVIPNLIDECFACIKKRGVDKAREYFKKMLAEAEADCIVISADFKDYFGSICHAMLISELTAFMDDPWAVWFFTMAINSNEKETGIGLGSELNQLSACSFPNRLDQRLKVVAASYTRYMDDIKIICRRSDEEMVMNILYEETERLGLTLSDKKTFSHSIMRPTAFLGFTYKRHETGRVTLKRKRDKFKNEKRKLRRMKRAEVPFEKVEEHYRCARATIKKGSRSDVAKMDRYFNNLFKEEIMEKKKKDVEVEMAIKEVQVCSKLIKEANDEDQAINMLIREKYSMSQELELHRKKLNGALPDETWEEYNAYVEECIKQVREERPQDRSGEE